MLMDFLIVFETFNWGEFQQRWMVLAGREVASADAWLPVRWGGQCVALMLISSRVIKAFRQVVFPVPAHCENTHWMLECHLHRG
jgi:hypothetical protein